MVTIKSAGVVQSPIYVGPDLPIFDQLNRGDIVTIRFYDSVIVAVTPGARMAPPIEHHRRGQEGARSRRRQRDAADQADRDGGRDRCRPCSVVTYHGFDNRRGACDRCNIRQLIDGLKVGDVVTITYTRARAATIKGPVAQRRQLRVLTSGSPWTMSPITTLLASPASSSSLRTASTSLAATARIMPMPMLSERRRSYSGTRPDSPSQRKIGGTRHDGAVDAGGGAGGKHARQVVGDAAAGDVRHALDQAAAEQRLDHRQVRAMRAQERVADGLAELRHVAVDVQLQLVERDLARQRIAVGVQAVRRQADQRVAGARSIGRR